MAMLETLEVLANTPGVSGDEGAVRRLIRETIQEHVDEVRVDHLGNLLAVKRARGNGKSVVSRVLIAAHMDEVGLMVIKVNDDGTLKFRAVGGIDPRVLPAKPVKVGKNAVAGIIDFVPIHLQASGDREKVPDLESLLIDTGGAGGVKAGDTVCFATRYGRVGRLLKGKAFDDRVGCTVLLELLKRNYPFELVGAFTVQEEIGLRGARVAAHAVQPDLAFALEGTIADDLPKQRDESPTTELGKGPAISIMDRSAFADRRLVQLLVETAQADRIPYQFKQPGIGGTDIGAIHLAREGVPSVAIAVPCRYIHSPAALLDPEDLEHTVALMARSLERLPDVWPAA